MKKRKTYEDTIEELYESGQLKPARLSKAELKKFKRAARATPIKGREAGRRALRTRA